MVDLIEINELTVDGRITGISFTVPSGSLTVILGPNGSGKTTVLKTIAGALRYQGTVRINGHEVAATSPKRLAALRAYAPQEPIFPPGMTVEQFVRLGRTPHRPTFVMTPARDNRIARQSMHLCEVDHLAHRCIETLSGGEKRRTALAQTIAQQVPVVILDEPTSALDVGHQQTFLELVDRLRIEQQTTFIVTMHDLTLTSQYATNAVFLKKGRLITAGLPGEVLRLEALENHYEAQLHQLATTNGPAFVPRRRNS